ncbi:MAG: hypothetical protein M3O09_05795 [Acidobacteriota bacterium]|nr:hypothetical protein [Acidobacteriota bacterium]
MAQKHKERKRDKETLFALFESELRLAKTEYQANLAKEHARTLGRLLENFAAAFYYAGLRKGFPIGVEAVRTKPSDLQIEIMEIIRLHPKLTTAELCEVLDQRPVPTPLPSNLKSLLRKKGSAAKRWTDAHKATDPHKAIRKWVDVYFSRLRKKAATASRLKLWRQLMREHTKLRKDPVGK